MAIDTENKRRSVTDFYLYVLPPVPGTPDTVSSRKQIAGLYSLPGAFSDLRGRYKLRTRPRWFAILGKPFEYLVWERVRRFIIK